LAAAASPITYVSGDDPPFITFHGTKDQRVAFLHAELIHAGLQKAGVTSSLVPITDGGHGSVSHPEVKTRGLQFVDKILRGMDGVIETTPLRAADEPVKRQ
jgi:dipeptidyl aminopeptidase/acylaminoacyl peptidase